MEQKRLVKIADCFYLDEKRLGLGLFSRPALFWKSGGGCNKLCKLDVN